MTYTFQEFPCKNYTIVQYHFFQGIITNGGVKPNIIPEESSLCFYIRTPKNNQLNELKEKIIKCFEAAAMATGCDVS